MNKELLIKKIKDLTKAYYKMPIGKRNIVPLEEIKNLINEYLEKHPQDTDIRLRLVMLEYTPPWEDPEQLDKYLNDIFKYDPNNIYATLILADVENFFWGAITDSLFKKLSNLSSKDSETMSMIELAKAWYYEEKGNDKLYEKHLLNSIKYSDKHVKNYRALANFYAVKGEKSKARNFAQRAINNIKEIFTQGFSITDVTDVEDFFNEFFKGTCTDKDNLNSLQKLAKE
jgi:hypothetical protein